MAPDVLEDYGALDISVVSDLPLFVDPFLLFNSDDPAYQRLHEGILEYLLFLRDLAAAGGLDEALINNLYRFKEVKQNWLGFTLFGNSGAGLGEKFAVALHGALGAIFADFGEETVTRGTHLEKLCLIRPGVGKDNISDFTTNLIAGSTTSAPSTGRRCSSSATSTSGPASSWFSARSTPSTTRTLRSSRWSSRRSG